MFGIPVILASVINSSTSGGLTQNDGLPYLSPKFLAFRTFLPVRSAAEVPPAIPLTIEEPIPLIRPPLLL